ncbi:MAG: penicillin-binding protein 2 [Actinobacteria bacterium]|nr:penicillin-binding protein 2 [Actinomycetota bacterium]MSX09254.1 penicillin-binding protein 2 [Actinomycetota bacterium]MSX68122.1 penicillin-binding protein 2 [Actinomycetota bacterium]
MVNIFGFGRRRSPRQPRIRSRRRSVSIADLVPSPDETDARPDFRLVALGGFFAILFGFLVLRLFTLQIVDAQSIKAAATATQVRVVPLEAPRGEITDRSATILVGNQVSQEIVLSRLEASQHPAVVGQVAALTNQTPAQVQAILNNAKYDPYQPAPIQTNASAATIQFLQEHPEQFPGVSVQETTSRTYPQGGTSGTHVLGYVGAISPTQLAENKGKGYSQASAYGKSGIEQFYQSPLRGTNGSQSIEVNAQGQVAGVVSQTNPIPGDTVVLNLDLGLQQTLQTVLEQQILADRQSVDKRSGKVPPAPNGAAIVMDPRSGAILAMASYPTYDLAQFVGGITQANLNGILGSGALNNYAISGLYTPGSTFKMITATAALQKGLISAGQYVNDTGTFTVPSCIAGGAGCVFLDDEAGGVGEVNMAGALTASSDYYFYNLGYLFAAQTTKYGKQPIQDVAAQYGLGQASGIDLLGGSVGRVDSAIERQKLHASAPKAFPNTTWYQGDNIEMAFGQGATAVTPLEMAIAYSTFLNGGTRYAPEVAAGLVSSSGELIRQYPPRVTGHVALTPAISDPILQGLLGVVQSPNGTAYETFKQYAHFNEATFSVGGKTGTASNSPGQEPNSWFVGFGPNPNPQYVIVCVIDQGGYGASAAAPVVAQTFNWLATNPVGPVKFPTASSPATTTSPTTNPPAK